MIVCAVCVPNCECRRLFSVNTSIVIVTVFRINTELKKTNPNFYAALCLVIGRRLYFTMVKVSMAVLIYLCKNFFLEGGLILKF